MAARPGRPKGTPKTGGRKKGTPNKATADIKEACQKHGLLLVEYLMGMAMDKSHPARVTAIKELLDRGYGRSTQPHEGDIKGDIVIRIVE